MIRKSIWGFGVLVGGTGVLVAAGLGVLVGGAAVEVGGSDVPVAGTAGSVGKGVSVGGSGVLVGMGVSVGGSWVGVGAGVSVGGGIAVGVRVEVNTGRGVLVGVGVIWARSSPSEQASRRMPRRAISPVSKISRFRKGEKTSMLQFQACFAHREQAMLSHRSGPREPAGLWPTRQGPWPTACAERSNCSCSDSAPGLRMKGRRCRSHP